MRRSGSTAYPEGVRGKVAVAAFVLLAACAQRTPAEIIAAAPAAVDTAKTASISMVTTVNVSGFGQNVTTKATGLGITDFAQKASNIQLKVSGSPIALAPCEVLERGSVGYLTISPKLYGPDHKIWTKLDVSKATGVDVNSLSSDPTSGIDYLKSVSGTVTTVGTETVRGAKTTHYHFTVTTDQLLAKITGAAHDRLKAQLAQLGITTVPIDTWIDDKGLPRRVSTDLKGSLKGVSIQAQSTVDMYNYGRPVNLTTPAASTVRDGVEPTKAFTDCFGVAV